jgi:hypothetical protein
MAHRTGLRINAGMATAPDVKQQLAAVRMMFDWLITGQIVPLNPARARSGESQCARPDPLGRKPRHRHAIGFGGPGCVRTCRERMLPIFRIDTRNVSDWWIIVNSGAYSPTIACCQSHLIPPSLFRAGGRKTRAR